MQFRAILFSLFALFFVDFTFARTRLRSTLDTQGSSKRTPTSTTPDVLSSRQHVAPRALLDVCVYLDTRVLLGANILGVSLADILDLDACICLSALPLILETNVHLKNLIGVFGKNAISQSLNTVVSPYSSLVPILR